MIGRTISHYRIVGQLGAGGMGIVYRAEDGRLGRAVALKFVPEELAHDRQAVDRLRAEARAASALNHSNICSIYDIGDDEGRPFIVMELLKGQSLRERLTTGPLKIHQLVDLGIQIADALDAAHTAGIIHRDIKPANIFLTERQVKLLDFGVAKLTEAYHSSGTTGTPDLTSPGATVGTISYMSPEQATGETLDGRTDLFSLGVVLYESSTGRPPFVGKTSAVILSAILNRAPVAPVALNPEVPLHLQEIINNCLEKDRELRYQSAADLRADLKRLRRDLESGPTRPLDSAASPIRAESSSRVAQPAIRPVEATLVLPDGRPPGTNRVRIAAASIITAAIIAGTAYVLWPRTQGPATVASVPAPGLTEADVQNRIDQAAAGIAARLSEQAKQNAAAERTRALQTSSPPAGSARAGGAAPAPPARSDPPRGAAPAPQISAPAQPAALPPPASTVPAQPRVEPSPVSVPPTVNTQPPSPPSVTTPPPQAPATTATTPSASSPSPVPSEPRREPAPNAAPPPSDARREPEDDADAAIRRVVATYARAIEAKDIALFRSVKPNLTSVEQRRLEDGFRAVSKQAVNITIVSIDRKGQDAVVSLRRRDTIQAGGRQQQTESQQMLTLTRNGNGWHIIDIR